MSEEQETLTAALPETPEQLQQTMAAALSSPDDKRADLVDRLKKRLLPVGQTALQGGDIIKRRKVSFDLDGIDCEPGMFVNEAGDTIVFKVTLQSLSSAQEIESMRGVRDATQAPYSMARLSFYAINDKVLDENDRNFFWEALGQAGRQICLNAFMSMGAASESAMGKYLSTRSEVY